MPIKELDVASPESLKLYKLAEENRLETPQKKRARFGRTPSGTDLVEISREARNRIADILEDKRNAGKKSANVTSVQMDADNLLKKEITDIEGKLRERVEQHKVMEIIDKQIGLE